MTAKICIDIKQTDWTYCERPGIKNVDRRYKENVHRLDTERMNMETVDRQDKVQNDRVYYGRAGYRNYRQVGYIVQGILSNSQIQCWRQAGHSVGGQCIMKYSWIEKLYIGRIYCRLTSYTVESWI